MGLIDGFARSALFTLDPETAHGLSISALKSGLVPGCRADRDPRLAVTVAGLTFPNPVGMAAGYDKNAEVPNELIRLGFGFAEIGTLTPKPQQGNPKPRIFRLVKDHAVINRLGFNNHGHDAAHARISGRRMQGLLGVNIGANKDSDDRVGDYVAGISRFADVADYFTVNISSPNTPGLRNLQTREALSDLLGRVLAERDQKSKRIPVFLKIAPDLTEPDLDDIAAECLAHRLDGVIVSNTTLSRTGLSADPKTREAGGLSGRPVFERSTIVLASAADPSIQVIAIDPHAGNDRGPQQIEGSPDEGQEDHELFLANLAAAGVADRVRHVRKPAADALGDVDGDIELLYIDGAHRYGPARDDIRDWGARVADGGTMLIHDSFSSVGVTLALMRLQFLSDRFRYLGRSSSMTIYRREPLTLGGRIRNALRQVIELPWFARNLVLKVMILAKLGRLTPLLGHRQGVWPH